MSQQNKDITFSTENLIKVRVKRTGFYVDAVDWDRLKRWVKNSKPTFNFWGALASASLSSSFSVFLTNLSITDPDYPYRNLLLVVMVGTLVVGVMSAIFSLLLMKVDTYTSDQIVQEMDTIAVMPTEPSEEFSEEVDAWTATTKSNIPQGTDSKELGVDNGKAIKFLTFQTSSKSNYWRAGCKLCSQAQKSTSPLLSPNSVLFHTGVQNGKVLVYYYENGVAKPIIHKVLPELSAVRPITLTVERADGKARFYLNNLLIKEADLPTTYFETIYLQAWGDGHIYNVNFDEIAYKTEEVSLWT